MTRVTPDGDRIVTDDVDSVGENFSWLNAEQVNFNFHNSSGFVLGKQTNFNGPVTIFTCTPEENTDQIWTTSNDKYRNKSSKGYSVNENYGVTCTDNTNDVYKTKRICLWNSKFLCLPSVAWILLIGIILCVIITIVLTVEFGNQDYDTTSDVVDPNDEFIITKSNWNGLDAASVVNLSTPVLYVVISHTKSSFCYDMVNCMSLIRQLQKNQMAGQGDEDIIYNYMIGGDGNVYEGRGWHHKSTLIDFVENNNYNIAFIGDFSGWDSPTYPQEKALKLLLCYGVCRSYIDQDYILMAHNESRNGASESPGRMVYAEIKKWDHFHANPYDEIRVPFSNKDMYKSDCVPCDDDYYTNR